MARWLVSQGDRQFSASDLDELKQLALEGKVTQTDMIQPPGASDWLYASELPQLKGLLQGGSTDDLYEEDDTPKRNILPMAIGLMAVIGVGLYFAYDSYTKLPEASDLELLGSGGMAMSEVLITANAPLVDKPGGSQLATVEKDTQASILGKREGWYHIRSAAGQEGYIKAENAIPAYMFADATTQQDHDPLYNPNNYVSVKNASWMQLDSRNKNFTLFQFMVYNQSKFPMTDLVLVATIKDKSDKELERVEIAVEGTIPPHEATMIGTIEQEDGSKRLMTTVTYQEMSQTDTGLPKLWTDGVGVELQAPGFSEANINVLEVRAIPPSN
jgi:hypothetical protein